MSKYLRAMGLCFSSSIVIALIGFVTTVAWPVSSPAQDGVCDGLEGAAYGLCNAYCNEMKCGTDQQKASDKGCGKVLNVFKRKSSLLYAPCNDPCAQYVKNNPDNECLCNFYNIKLTADCWGPSQSNNVDEDPVFTSCDFSPCGAGPSFDECSLEQCTKLGPMFCGIWGPRVSLNNPVGSYECEYYAAPPACGVASQVSHQLSEEQFVTCVCRLEHYTDDLAEVEGSGVDPNNVPYMCEQLN